MMKKIISITRGYWWQTYFVVYLTFNGHVVLDLKCFMLRCINATSCLNGTVTSCKKSEKFHAFFFNFGSILGHSWPES